MSLSWLAGVLSSLNNLRDSRQPWAKSWLSDNIRRSRNCKYRQEQDAANGTSTQTDRQIDRNYKL